VHGCTSVALTWSQRATGGGRTESGTEVESDAGSQSRKETEKR